VGEIPVLIARMERSGMGEVFFFCEKLKGRVMLEEVDLDGMRIMSFKEI